MALTGSQVVAKHQAAMAQCTGQTSWALLSCIVDAMHAQYKGAATIVGAAAPRKWYVGRE